jgi:hypothetical protein
LCLGGDPRDDTACPALPAFKLASPRVHQLKTPVDTERSASLAKNAKRCK